MDVSGVSFYVNPNTGQLTTNIKNAAYDRKTLGNFSN